MPGAMPETTTEPGRDAQPVEQATENEEYRAVDALQKALKSEREVRREAERKLKELAKANEAAELSALEAKGKYSEAAEILKRKQEEADAAKADAESQIQTFFRDQALRTAARDLIADDMLEDVIEKHGKKFKFIDGQIVGEVQPAEFFAELIKKQPSLARAKPVSGLGIAGTSATSGGKSLSRDAFNKMTAMEQLRFVKNGGQLT